MASDQESGCSQVGSAPRALSVAKLFGGIWPDESAALPHGVQAIYDTYPLTSNQETQAADRTLENASEYIKRVLCPDAD